MHPRTCAYRPCGRTFLTDSPIQRSCSPACRVALHRYRRRGHVTITGPMRELLAETFTGPTG